MQRLFSPTLIVGFVALAAGGLLVWSGSDRHNAAAGDDSVADAGTVPSAPAKKLARPVGQEKPGRLPEGVIALDALTLTESAVRKRHKEIETGLQTRYTGDLKDVTLKDVLERFSKQGKVRVVVDEKAFADEGILTDTTVTHRFKDVTVEQALMRVLTPLDLTHVIHNEAVFVTTSAVADEMLVTRVYAVGDLNSPKADKASAASVPFGNGFAANDGGGDPDDVVDHSWLQDMIKSATSGQWLEDDGSGGSISTTGDSLVIHQTHKVHQEIAGTLAGLRLAATGTLKGRLYFVKRKYYPHKADALIRRKLAETVELKLKGVTLRKTLLGLGEESSFTVVIDEKALDDEGVDTDTKITLNVSRVTLRTVFREILSPMSLTTIIEEGTLIVTTTANSDERLSTTIFDVNELLKAGVDSGKIVDMLKSETDSQWMEDDGAGGSISMNNDWGVLVVRQTGKVHEEIGALLVDTNRALAKAAKQAPPRKVKPEDPNTIETRIYVLAAAAFESKSAKQTAEAITTFVEPDSWKQKGLAIKVVDNTLVVRQSVKAHRAIRALLKTLEPPELQRGFGGGGTSGLGTPSGGFF